MNQIILSAKEVSRTTKELVSIVSDPPYLHPAIQNPPSKHPNSNNNNQKKQSLKESLDAFQVRLKNFRRSIHTFNKLIATLDSISIPAPDLNNNSQNYNSSTSSNSLTSSNPNKSIDAKWGVNPEHPSSVNKERILEVERASNSLADVAIEAYSVMNRVKNDNAAAFQNMEAVKNRYNHRGGSSILDEIIVSSLWMLVSGSIITNYFISEENELLLLLQNQQIPLII